MSTRLNKIFPLTLAISSAITHQHVFAQDEKKLEEIYVTGSRILRNPLDEAAPITNLSAEDLDNSGLLNFGDILQQLPMAGSSINSRFNVPGNSGFPQDGTGIGAGATEIALRNLGAKRTLVLIDGKRWIAGASASGVPSSVDLNTLPANVIQRVEVLQDGASAIYGSDAIGGVVNVITNRDFEGFKLDMHTSSNITYGDGESYELSGLWGIGNETSHIVFSASRIEEKSIFTSARAQSAYPSPFASSCLEGGCSSFTPQARLIFGSNYANGADITLNDGVLNDGGANIPVFDPNNPTADDFHEFSAADRFNFNGENFNYLKTPSTRFNFFTNITHDFNENLTFIGKAVYTNRFSSTGAAPEPLCLGNDCGNAILNNIVIDADQIYNPFGVDLSVADGTLDFFGRRPLESGPRTFEQDVNTFFTSAGLEGEFTLNSKSYVWDFTLNYGKNRGVQQKFGSHNAAKLAIALGDPDLCAAVPNCVPFNFFGGQGPNGEGSITQEMLDYVGYVQRDISHQTLFDLTANITANLIELPAGPLGIAAGFEYREHDGAFEPDPVAASGETAGIPSGATSGSFDVNEFYVEFNAPLIEGATGADYLEFNGALRASNYSSFGSASTYKASLLWRPIADLSVRTSQSTGIRAPGIGELFGGAARGDFTFLDPCADVLANVGSANGGRDTPQPQAIVDNCAALNVPTSYAQTNPQLSTRSLGNEELTTETSDNTSLGLVYSPSWLVDTAWVDSLHMSVDYFDLTIDDAIQGIPASDIITSCVETLDSAFCDLVERSSAGGINLVQNRLQNIGGIETSGIDFSLDYSAPEIGLGSFAYNLSATRLIDYREITSGNPEGDELSGRITDETFQRAFPDWRMTSSVNWHKNNWGAGLTFRYVSDMVQDSGNTLTSEVFTDLRIQYRAGEEDKYIATLGANNIFDNDPAVCDSCGVINMSPVVHDIPGTVLYFKLSVKLD